MEKCRKKQTKLWKCGDCGVVLEEISDCAKGPVCVPHCCGVPMTVCLEKTRDGAAEKHVPVYTRTADGCKVSVGAVPHPMTEEHHIEWVEIITPDGFVCRKYLENNESPEAFFACRIQPGSVMREYCNLHGLWSAEIV